MTIKYLAITALLTLTSCTSIPEKRAERAESATELPASYSAEVFPELKIVDSLLDLFDDAEVNRYTQLALENNPNLLRMYAQMEEAGFNFQKTRGSLFPSLSGNGAATKSGSSASSTSNTYSASLDARWEVDIWGELRNRTKASKADLATAEANYEAFRQSLAAQTMQSWFELVAATQLLDLAERQLKSFESTHRLVERRYESGTASSTEVDLAHTDAASSRADYESRKNNRDQVARTLKALIGHYPDAAIEAGLNWPKLNRTVPSDLPSELLLARPDIIAAYQSIRASDARARAAYADLFPSFTLTASGGRSSDTLSDLGRSAFDVWSLAGQVAAPIFEGGSRRAEVGAADQRAEQAYQNYRSVVLNSFREVENALNSESYLAREESQRLIALDAARRAEAKSQRDYESGLIELLDLLTAQRRVYNIETQTINLRQARLSNRVSLALALGTGI
ncbi:MAG: efflux transporter outer membrane subunit [Opitutaceae bacterium]